MQDKDCAEDRAGYVVVRSGHVVRGLTRATKAGRRGEIGYCSRLMQSLYTVSQVPAQSKSARVWIRGHYFGTATLLHRMVWCDLVGPVFNEIQP